VLRRNDEKAPDVRAHVVQHVALVDVRFNPLDVKGSFDRPCRANRRSSGEDTVSQIDARG